MKRENIFLLVAAVGIFLFVYNYYYQGLLTTAQAIFCFALFTCLAALLIWTLGLLAKNLASALKLEENQAPRYFQEVPKKKRKTRKVGDLNLVNLQPVKGGGYEKLAE